MTSSKPMSDGGKGSVRRNEDTEAYRNNYDAIFGKKNKDKEPMIEQDHEDDHDDTCSWCGGCGEGDYDGAACRKCGGTGVEPYDNDDEIGECYDIDD